MKTWKAYLLEVAVIIFSVLIALWFDQLRENYNKKQDQIKILRLLIEETENNYALINSDLEKLSQFNNQVKSHYERTGSLKPDMVIDFYLLSPSYSTWEAAKASGKLSNFDSKIVKTIISIYSVFQSDLGFSHEDHVSTYFSKGLGEYASIKEIVDAMIRMEDVYRAKLNMLNGGNITSGDFHQKMNLLKDYLAQLERSNY